ncbi:MAG: sigma-70 family RNA polymerase sigma factor [Planctomycetes bacterium]|nr:sigma-70 family RNA polymerase sigma factor [Planctomycetota bacterium]
MHTTSETLLGQLKRSGGNAAWSRFVHLYSRLIYSWLRKAGLQDSDAADVTQDVFVVLVRELPKFEYDQNKSFRGWLRTITLNKWRDHCRRRGLPINAYVELAELHEQPDLFAAREYRSHLVEQALGLLRPEFRSETWDAFIRHGVQGLPASDVARDLGLTVGAVYAAKCRVLARLRTDLRDVLD